MFKLFKRLWTHILISFCDNYTIEGFGKTQKYFELPENISHLDPVTKRKVTICNLFANQNVPIKEIVQVLDSSLHQVIPTLIENRLIKERRRKRGNGVKSNTSNPLSLLPIAEVKEDVEAKEKVSEERVKPEERMIIDGTTPSWFARENPRLLATPAEEPVKEGLGKRSGRRIA